MSRKKFIESHGATCQNWNWSWSFINQIEKVVIFGAWDKHTNPQEAMILSEDRKTSHTGRVQNGYGQSREHIRLIEDEGYQLKTFPMQYASSGENETASPCNMQKTHFKSAASADFAIRAWTGANP